MGYVGWVKASSFRLRAEHHEAALAAVKALHGAPDAYGPNEFDPVHRTVGLTRLCREADNLIDCLAYWTAWEPEMEIPGWQVCILLQYVDEATEDIVGWGDEAHKCIRDYSLICALAPFMDEGGWIEYEGEDGGRWRYVFEGGKAVYYRPQTTWLRVGERGI